MDRPTRYAFQLVNDLDPLVAAHARLLNECTLNDFKRCSLRKIEPQSTVWYAGDGDYIRVHPDLTVTFAVL